MVAESTRRSRRAARRMPAPVVRYRGLEPYAVTWSAMRAFTDGRDCETRDELWVTEHHPVYTLGQAGRLEHLLDAGGVEVVRSDRGGQITYHGPGQVVVYVLLDLVRRGIGVRALVRLLEQSVIDALADLGVTAVRREGAPGVYVRDAKVAALGLRVRRGCSYHGLAVNVRTDLAAFSRIDPCGYRGLAVTEVAALVPGASVASFTPGLLRGLLALLVEAERARVPQRGEAERPRAREAPVQHHAGGNSAG